MTFKYDYTQIQTGMHRRRRERLKRRLSMIVMLLLTFSVIIFMWKSRKPKVTASTQDPVIVAQARGN